MQNEKKVYPGVFTFIFFSLPLVDVLNNDKISSVRSLGLSLLPLPDSIVMGNMHLSYLGRFWLCPWTKGVIFGRDATSYENGVTALTEVETKLGDLDAIHNKKSI